MSFDCINWSEDFKAMLIKYNILNYSSRELYLNKFIEAKRRFNRFIKNISGFNFASDVISFLKLPWWDQKSMNYDFSHDHSSNEFKLLKILLRLKIYNETDTLIAFI